MSAEAIPHHAVDTAPRGLGALVVDALLLLVGVALLLRPSILAGRFGAEGYAAAMIAPGLGITTSAIGVGRVLSRKWTAPSARLALQCALGVCVYASLTLAFWDWHIDDAAITYSFSENLVSGLGLVIHRGHAPEEAYSSTLWMLLLALLRFGGMDVALASKVLATLVGSSTVALTFVTLAQLLRRPAGGASQAVLLAALTTSPFLIWTISGLEHGMQAALLVGLMWSAIYEQRLLRWAPWFGAALVLLRPEAPLLIASFTLVLAFDVWREERSLRPVLRLWPVAVVPMLALGGLIAFRLWYFHDLLPTPFYAKVHGSGLFRLLNPLSSGYEYALGWFARGGGFLLAMPLVSMSWTKAPRAVRAGLALVLGQFFFVAYAGGDWMDQWRFLAAPIALLGLLAAYGIEQVQLGGVRWPSRYATFAVAALVLCNVRLLVDFRAKPTTPYLTVSAIGKTFVELADRLDIAEPVLAHHDAGGTSYRAKLALVDLAGLTDRVVAQHLEQPEFLRKYILEERKPDFVFGTTGYFAAAFSRFHETPEFKRDYVRLEFPDRPYMKADLCHIRRDRLHDVQGIVQVGDSVIVSERK